MSAACSADHLHNLNAQAIGQALQLDKRFDSGGCGHVGNCTHQRLWSPGVTADWGCAVTVVIWLRWQKQAGFQFNCSIAEGQRQSAVADNTATSSSPGTLHQSVCRASATRFGAKDPHRRRNSAESC